MAGEAGILKAVLSLENQQFIDALNRSATASESAASQIEAGFGGVKDTVDNLGKALAAAGLVTAVVEFGASCFEAADKVDKLHDSFVNLNGAGEDTEALFQSMQDLEASSIFDFEDTLGPAAQTMLGFKVATEDVDKYLRTLADTASALHLPEENIKAAAEAMGRMSQEGELTTKGMKALSAAIGGDAYAVLAERLGVTIPQAMEIVKKGAISAKDGLAALTDGLDAKYGGAAEKMTHTWEGALNKIDQAAEDVRTALGDTLKNALTALVPVMETVVGWIKQFAEWFTNLSEPVKNGILIFTGLATAVVAVTMAMAPMKLVLLAMGEALAGPVLPILAVTAALTALGVWVYENWAPITAVLSQAWEGVTEAWVAFGTWLEGWWGSLWSGLVEIYQTLFGVQISIIATAWDAVSAAWSFIWEGIKNYLGGVWNGIKEIANTVWTAITGAIQKFLEFAEKIPGVNKLFNLDEAWNSAKKLQEATEANTTAQKEHQKELGATRTAVNNYTVDQKKLLAGTKQEKEATKAAAEAKKALAREQKFANERAEEAIEKQGRLTIATEKMKERVEEAWREMEKFADQVDSTNRKLPPIKLNLEQLTDGLTKIETPTPLEKAMKSLGLTSEYELQKAATEAKKAYETIVASDQASQWEKDSALIKLLEAQMAVAKSMGETIPQDQLKMLEKLKEQTDLKLPEAENSWKTFGTNVSTVITNFAQDISDSLWDGDLSWGEKGKNLLTSLGKAVTSSFIEPATAAISTFITGALTDLLSGKGFGGVFDLIGNIGSKIGGIFGGGGSGSGGTPGFIGSGIDLMGGLKGIKVPGMGGVGGILGKVGGGLSGVLGAVGGIGSMVSGIIGNFQNARLEGTMNAVEENTRYGMIHLFYILDNLNTQLPLLWYLPAMLQFLQDWNQPFWEMRWSLVELYKASTDAGSHTGRMALACEAMLGELHENLIPLSVGLLQSSQEIAKQVQQGRILAINVTATGVTTKEAATALGNQIASNLSTQMVQTSF